MKTQNSKSIGFDRKRRSIVVLLSFLCLSLLFLTPGAAQLRNLRHVTAIQLGGAAEGSRVTVVSDSALSDYEAFRRGNRFYLKLPLADLAAAAPSFRANGFDDVQVQKTSDGLIVSFKLQPGATARVDQHGSRLDVVFTASNRVASNNSTPAGSSMESSDNSTRVRDRAGPTPLDGASSGSRERFVSARPESGRGSRWPRNSVSQTKPKTDVNKNSNASGNRNSAATASTNSNNSASKQPTPLVAVAASPSPVWSPSALSSPGVSSAYQPLSSVSPAYSSPQPVAGSTNANGPQNSSTNFQSAARRWISSNRLATLLGALILLSLIAYLMMAIRRRQENGSRTKLAKFPKVQPRYSGDELSELGDSNAKPANRESASKVPLTKAAAAGTPADKDPWVLAMPTIVTPPVAPDEHSEQEEDREVFEL